MALKRNKTYPENSFFTMGNTASLRNALLTVVISSIQNIGRASTIKRRALSYLFLIQRPCDSSKLSPISFKLHSYVFLINCHHQRKGRRILTMSGNCYILLYSLQFYQHELAPTRLKKCTAQ